MPGWFKKAWYGLASLLSLSSFILIITALAVPHWLSGKILCQTGVDLVNATDPELVKFIGDIYYGLFQGCKVRQCGLGGRRSQFTKACHGGQPLGPSDMVCSLKHQNYVGLIKDVLTLFLRRTEPKKVLLLAALGVPQRQPPLLKRHHLGCECINLYQIPASGVFPHLVKELNTGLHVTILLLLLLALALALVSMGFAILNMIQVPYKAVNGPGGICLWNVLAGGVVALAISSFTAAVKFHDLTERIANFQEKLFHFVVVEEQYEESFWICVASASAHAANLIVVAISQIPLPEIKTKIEEATVTAEDILY